MIGAFCDDIGDLMWTSSMIKRGLDESNEFNEF